MTVSRHIRRLLVSVLAVIALLLSSGCGAEHGSGQQADSASTGTHRMADGQLMKDSEMHTGKQSGGDDENGEDHLSHVGVDGQPSPTAAMVCGEEIQAAVVRTFALTTVPTHTSTWKNQLFRCTYTIDGAALRLSVKDLNAEPAGRTYFNRLRSSLPGPRTIKGVAAFGFPAFQTRHGDVVFLKDHKTLWVDASRIPASRLPPGFGRTGVAYGVASAVIACWTE